MTAIRVLRRFRELQDVDTTFVADGKVAVWRDADSKHVYEYASSIPGPAGPQGSAGPEGPEGPQGTAGPEGPEGPTGPDGDTGPEGPTGAQGESGPEGPEGDPGPSGTTGPAGSQGVQGPTGPTGPQGSTGTGVTMRGTVASSSALPASGNTQGDAFIVTTDDSLWIWDATQWVTGGPIQGPPGPPGPTGSQGPTGATGPQGLRGFIGATGPQGSTGPQGPQGKAGPKGNTGAKGDTGPQGPTGPQGQAGPQGPTGATGPIGSIGAPGGGTQQSDWNWLSASTSAHVAAGRIGVNNDAPTAATQVRLHRLDQHTIDWGSTLPTLAAGDHLYLQQLNLATSWHRYLLTGPPTVAAGDTDNWVIPVSTESGSPQGTEPANGVAVLVAFQFTPAQGPTGPQGPQGATGSAGAIGPTGPQGSAGSQGPEGPQGDPGPEGPDGAQGPSGSLGPKDVEVKVCGDADAVTTGDGKTIFCVPASLGGRNLTAAHAFVTTASSSGAPTVQLRNITQTADMLTTKVTIDASEFTSYTANTQPVIDLANDDVATGDLIAVDIDAAGTGAKGLGVILTLAAP